MTREEEKDLIKKYIDGDQSSFEKLIKDGLRLSISVAKKYDDISLSIVGLSGWLKALDHYDISKDYKFSNYSTWWIKNEIEKKVK